MRIQITIEKNNGERVSLDREIGGGCRVTLRSAPRDRMIATIKAIRTATGLSLREAKTLGEKASLFPRRAHTYTFPDSQKARAFCEECRGFGAWVTMPSDETPREVLNKALALIGEE